jgi:hypothetical protein
VDKSIDRQDNHQHEIEFRRNKSPPIQYRINASKSNLSCGSSSSENESSFLPSRIGLSVASEGSSVVRSLCYLEVAAVAKVRQNLGSVASKSEMS